MKAAIVYPPLPSTKGVPLLSQNRQFQWFSKPTYIYPVVPAYAATLAEKAGHSVVWFDGIAEEWTYELFLKRLLAEKPDVVLMETKTPVIKQHWQIIKQIKKKLRTIVVMVGDHVTALPEESLSQSSVDYILTGGDYDFLFLNLLEHLQHQTKLEPGIWYKQGKKIKHTGNFQLNHDLNTLPLIDRNLTKWQLYAYKNGNYRRFPGTYIMAGRDCWWRRNGGCTFCSWTTLYPTFHQRTVESVLDEIGDLIDTYGVKEIMDDTGTFPVGTWLRQFCEGMIKRGYNKKIYFDINMRFGVLTYDDYVLMAKAGIRFMLYGLESANQDTLNRLNKGTDITKIEAELKNIRKANKESGGKLQPHVTCMVGYPWEDLKDAENTVSYIGDLFKKNLIDTLQATVVIPYPGTPLFKECKERGLLLTEDWNDFDMKQAVMKSPIENSQLMKLTRNIYVSFVSLSFIWKKITQIKSLEDVNYLIKAGLYVIAHIIDFKNNDI